MATYEKLNGVITFATNSPGAPTGYGTQAKYVVDRLKRHGVDVAVASNYGFEGGTATIATPYGKVPHYPKGWAPHSIDVLPLWHEQHLAQHLGKPNFILTLYDVWVYNQMKHDGRIVSWVPIDHETLPPAVGDFVQRKNVHPIAMAPHGQRVLEARNIECSYVPHAVDTTVFKPTKKIDGVDARVKLGVDKDAFLVTMVANNKSNGYVHRKAFGENLMAFAVLQKAVPNARLYLHSDWRPIINGFDLAQLLRSVGLSDDTVIVADPNRLMVGYPQKELAAIYTASDVLLAASYGEGFNVPLIEAQACGTPVITSNWTAPVDLAGPTSYRVDGQPWWNNMQRAYWRIPSIASITEALQTAHAAGAGRGVDEASVEFAKQFEVERVWNDYWMPVLRELLS